jgi:hypothetical protein
LIDNIRIATIRSRTWNLMIDWSLTGLEQCLRGELIEMLVRSASDRIRLGIGLAAGRIHRSVNSPLRRGPPIEMGDDEALNADDGIVRGQKTKYLARARPLSIRLNQQCSE